MKNTLKLLVLLLVCNFGYSQIYYSHYLDATSEWKVFDHHGEASYHDITFKTIFFEGLENLNGYTYYKMYQTYYTIGYEFGYSSVLYPQSANITQFIGYFREDPNGKFYLFNNGSTPFFFNNQLFSNGIETVFFDNQTVLNAQIGDMYFPFCSVDSIDILNINTSDYKKISSLFAGVGLAGQALEGVGDIFHSCNTSQAQDFSLATFIRIHCYTKQGQTYAFYDNYYLPNFVLVDCTTFPNANRQGLSTLTYENSSFDVFPNPAQNELQIAYKGVSVVNSIVIYDLSGRVVYTASTMASSTFSAVLNISELQSGSYVVVLKNGEKKVVTKQLIKE
jgi:hypothetical protein